MNHDNSKCSEYGSNVKESSGGGRALGLPNRNVEAHVVSSGPPRGPEYQCIRRGNRVNIIFIDSLDKHHLTMSVEVTVHRKDSYPGDETDRPDKEASKAPNHQLLDFLLSLKLWFPAEQLFS